MASAAPSDLKMRAAKRTEVFDSEVYRNYFLVGFKDLATGKVVSVEVFGEKNRLSKADRLWLRDRFRKVRTIGFNSINFDLPLIYGAIAGLTCLELKTLANDIIEGGMKHWEVADAYGFDIPRNLDHIDLFEVAPGKTSLKIFNGRLHGRRMQDLPIAHDARLTEEDVDVVYDYWKNDLAATELLFDNLQTHIALRVDIGKRNGLDLRSKSDAQVAEAVIKAQVTKILGEPPKKPTIAPGSKFRYRAPEYIRFHSKQMNDLLDRLEEWDFRLAPKSQKVLMPDFLTEALIPLGYSTYQMGIGGLHSTEKNTSHVADEDTILKDVDVESYYPAIIINRRLMPPQIGKAFLKVYKGIVDRRLKAKAELKRVKVEIADLEERIKGANQPSELMAEKLAELKVESHYWDVEQGGLKIAINGSFGKLGSSYSALFAPELMIAVTITGQLSLLMLIERIERRGIPVVSGNTDGIVIKCPRDREDELNGIIKRWEEDTSFKTEETQYQALYSASCNNYIAIKKGGGTKRKGHYAKSGLEEKKNPTFDICAEAVADYIEKGVPISETIRKCRDIRKFVTVRKVNGGAIFGVKEVEFERISEKTGRTLKPGTMFDASGAEYLGSAIRWFQSTCDLGAIHYRSNNNMVPKSEGARPIMEMDGTFPSDVDFGWYIRAARQMLRELAYEKDVV